MLVVHVRVHVNVLEPYRYRIALAVRGDSVLVYLPDRADEALHLHVIVAFRASMSPATAR